MEENVRWLKTQEEIFPARPYSLTKAFQTKKYSFDMHEHDFYEINIILEGSGYHFIENRTITVEPGDMFVIPPGVLHGYKNIDEVFNVFHLAAKNEFFDRYAEELNQLDKFKVLFEIEPYLRVNEQNFYIKLDYDYLLRLKNTIDSFDTLKFNESDEADTMRNILSLVIIASLCRYTSQNFDRLYRDKTNSNADILKALEYIHTNYGEKLTINVLASVCNMSRSTFIRKFKECTNTSPNKYILNYRCENAKNLLIFGMPHTEVAHRCGFFDVSHMDKSLLKYRAEKAGG